MKKTFLVMYNIFSVIFLSGTMHGFWKPQFVQNYQRTRAEKHVGNKPACIQLKPYRNGSYIQFNFDAQDFGIAMTAKMMAQTMYAMAHTGTRIENFKTAVWRPGIARSIINWVPFMVTCSMLASIKDRFELKKELQEVRRLQHNNSDEILHQEVNQKNDNKSE